MRVTSDLVPCGDQPRAIDAIVRGFEAGRAAMTLMGVTGSGKTFSVAHAIARLKLPTLVISHNKTLAAQLYGELKDFLGESAVEYFVSYYDYFQPEAYVPARDLYIEKDASINQDLDQLRMRATNALLTRKDVVIVASVSCIYGLGSPVDYQRMLVELERGKELDRDALLAQLVQVQYLRNDLAFERGTFRVRGDVVEVMPTYSEYALRVELFGDTIEALAEIDPLTGELVRCFDRLTIWPAKHYVVPEDRLRAACAGIRAELGEQLFELKRQNKLVEAQRLEQRTLHDLELLEQIGRCPGVENYSLHLTGRKTGDRPYCLIDYFPRPFLCVVDESHATIPQIRGMFAGDRSRKLTLVEHGFRLPSALENRPLDFDEWVALTGDRHLFVSATPGPWELERCGGEVVEQVIRPTGLLDPVIEVRPATGQIADLEREIALRVDAGERVLVTTLTKRLAEDVARHLAEGGFRAAHLHSEQDAFERVELLKNLRLGQYDVLVGINLLREGLDLPEVSMVAILDADKEGFLRNETSLIQTIGRAARHEHAKVILYGERITPSMQAAIDETNRRRVIQAAYNAEHGITPRSVTSAIKAGIVERKEDGGRTPDRLLDQALPAGEDVALYAAELEREMLEAADALEFEKAARLRDRLQELRKTGAVAPRKPAPRRRRR